MGTHVDSFRNGHVRYYGSDASSVRQAVRFARKITGRRQVLEILPPDQSTFPLGKHRTASYRTVFTNDISTFCQTLANSENRLAAIIVTPDEKDLKYKRFLREVRELTSAEGALLIWKEGIVSEKDKIPTEFFGIRPDVICLQGDRHETT